MEMKLGKGIANLRKAKNMTQEQLAASVGVSAPAVSKWETDSSYPDISLLCPIARALDTNVDTLLHFEDTLTSYEIADHMKDIMDFINKGDCYNAEDTLQRLLHAYPSSIELKYRAFTILCTFIAFCPNPSKDKIAKWEKEKEFLLNEVHAAVNSPYFQHSVSGLAAIAIANDDLEKAELLLRELPERNIDTSMLWSQIYLKREEPEKALEFLQKRLYTLVQEIQLCLVSMMSEKVVPDNEKLLYLCNTYRKLENLFGIGGGLSDGFFVEAYKRMGNSEKLKESLLKMIEAVLNPLPQPKQDIFSPAIKTNENHNEVSKHIKQMILRGLSEDNLIDEFQEDIEFQEAFNKLKESIEEDTK